jgi:hypothetical protein
LTYPHIIEEYYVISRMSSLPSASIPEEITDAGHSLVELIFDKKL